MRRFFYVFYRAYASNPVAGGYDAVSVLLFPWIGLLTGGLCLGWAWFCRAWQVGALLFAGGMTLLPLIVSGGIHLDGLVDTADALYSRRETEKKLEILKDPHVGAFWSDGLLRLSAGKLCLMGASI